MSKKKSTAIPTAARDAVAGRQHGRCLRCGVFPFAEVHHRQPRRIGGHGLENLAGLCGVDHRWLHANPRLAREEGFIVSIHSLDISAVPVSAWDGTYLLNADGTTSVYHC